MTLLRNFMTLKDALRHIMQACVALTGLSAGTVLASDYSDGWGPAVGSALPVLEAPDHTGQLRTLDDLVGEQGLMLFLSRSADW